MIPQRDISRLANRLYVGACESIGKKQALRIPESIIERDYCLAWLLCVVSQHPLLSEVLAFKGGTALRRVHFGDYRFSEDLDFTLVRDVELDGIFAAFDEVFERLRGESGIAFRRSVEPPTRHVRNDTFYFEFKGPLPAQNSVKVDITRGETLVFDLEQKPVIRSYPEFADMPDKRHLLVYSFAEIVIEKTLAVTDGARREPRDLYDLWYIQSAGHLPAPQDLVHGLNRKLASREGRAEDILTPRLEKAEKVLRRAWEQRLRSQVMSLPEFDGCYRDVKRLLTDFDRLRERQ
jgi:predicted nucleotidyltransferase component of viral defense system